MHCSCGLRCNLHRCLAGLMIQQAIVNREAPTRQKEEGREEREREREAMSLYHQDTSPAHQSGVFELFTDVFCLLDSLRKMMPKSKTLGTTTRRLGPANRLKLAFTDSRKFKTESYFFVPLTFPSHSLRASRGGRRQPKDPPASFLLVGHQHTHKAISLLIVCT